MELVCSVYDCIHVNFHIEYFIGYEEQVLHASVSAFMSGSDSAVSTKDFYILTDDTPLSFCSRVGFSGKYSTLRACTILLYTNHSV